jgi:hypothetical protein
VSFGVLPQKRHDLRSRTCFGWIVCYPRGNVRLSFKSEGGKNATFAILGKDDFFGEGGLAGQLVRMSSASAITDCILLHIDADR